ncbi:beta-Casp domain protein [Shuttleworthella sp. MSX8B]|uniref:MBL fold metallo-hydrolase RNA specificity domain-containing protein n=1 Tax=Shuttleworthella sp. MSX8B TaxID=936574 RepID=UPI0004468590|nr:MBL fold metallo-hydrolase [Shuttleworthia sp. MSX8B]EUB13847.1 beta-Casp domain protein [Shuttleworthia sp. MSX8B]
MKITFIGAAHEVTGSCHYVEAGDKKFLVDCGMEQGADIYENQEIPVNPSDLDYIFVTHAHIDHSGLLPLLYVHGFRGTIFSTEATRQLCNIMLKDSAHIQEQEAEWKNRKAQRSGGQLVEPMYTSRDAEKTLQLFEGIAYGRKIEVSEGIQVRFNDAGHLLGSSFIEIWLRENGIERKIVFSGDLGNHDRPLIKNPEHVTDADYVLIESTYGDRVHDKPQDFAVPLAQVILDTLKRGGNIVIPAFSVGRTQELLYYIRRIKEEGLIPAPYTDFEVYMDSPLAVEATNVFNKSVSECFDQEALELVQKGINPIAFPGLRVAVSSEESKAINFDEKPKLIISASGMCEAGRIRHHLKHNLWRPESSVIFVGYQVPGTLGYNLLNGARHIKLFGEEVEVRAQICELPGISGHADRNMLLEWLGGFKEAPSRVFVVHGEDQVTDAFAAAIKETCGYDSYAPYSGDSFDLITGDQVAVGSHVRKEKVPGKARTSSAVFGRLVAAGERLMAVIRRSEGGANKDLGKFADQIDALSNKWDR